MRKKQGQIYIYVVVLMAIGMIVISPLLSYINSSNQMLMNSKRETDAYLAADAGMAAVISDITQFRINSSYTLEVSLNGFTSSVSVTTPADDSVAPPPAEENVLYIDPGVAIGMQCLNARTDQTPSRWVFKLIIPQDHSINVSWVHNRGDTCGNWQENLGEGRGKIWLDTDANPSTGNPGYIAVSQTQYWSLNQSIEIGWPSPVTLNVSWPTINTSRTDNDQYYLIFDQFSGYEKKHGQQYSWVWQLSNAIPFDATGNSSNTWVKIGKIDASGNSIACQDYIVSSTVKDDSDNDIVKITAYIRQTPGAAAWWREQKFEILSWQVTW
jgi:hypothetical protein